MMQIGQNNQMRLNFTLPKIISVELHVLETTVTPADGDHGESKWNTFYYLSQLHMVGNTLILFRIKVP